MPKKSAKKAQVVALVKAPAPRKKKAKRNPGRQVRRMDPFVECVYGPVSMMMKTQGVPDGSQKPSFVMDHIQFFTAKPDGNNRLAFAITGCSTGSVAIKYGKWDMNVPVVNSGDGSIQGWTGITYDTSSATYATTFTTAAREWLALAQLPYVVTWFREMQRGQVLYDGAVVGSAATGSPLSAFGVDSFRLITNSAVVGYTGSALTNQGVVTACRSELCVDAVLADSGQNNSIPNPEAPFVGAVGFQMCSGGYRSQQEIMTAPGGVMAPVTKGARLINVPQKFEYQPAHMGVPYVPSDKHAVGTDTVSSIPAFASVYVFSKPGDPDDGKLGFAPVGAFGHSTATYYWTAGMDPSASVSLLAKSCIEWSVTRDSPFARVAGPSPEPRPAAIAAVKAMAPKVPALAASEGHDHGWLGNAAEWYGNTMAKVVGGVYSAGGQILSKVFAGSPAGAMGSAIGGLGQQMSQLSIGY